MGLSKGRSSASRCEGTVIERRVGSGNGVEDGIDPIRSRTLPQRPELFHPPFLPRFAMDPDVLFPDRTGPGSSGGKGRASAWQKRHENWIQAPKPGFRPEGQMVLFRRRATAMIDPVCSLQ